MTEVRRGKVGKKYSKKGFKYEETFIIGFDCAFYIMKQFFSKYFINR